MSEIGPVIIDLRKPDLRKCDAGTHVISTGGFTWQLIERTRRGEIWHDVTSGLTWLPIESTRMDHYVAVKTQTDLKRLPTKEEFEEAEKHGFTEVLDGMKDRFFWCASVHPGVGNYACVFYGNGGDIGSYGRSVNDGSVRCVAGR